MALTTINPATEEVVREFPEMTDDELRAALELADRAQQGWSRTSFAERADRMRAAAGVLRRRADEFARLCAIEMGKPLGAGRAEVEKCALVCDYYAEHAERFLADEDIDTEASHSFVAFRPLGVVLAVMPWNFPFWQVFRFAAPGLMAGNGGLLKHASNVQGCAQGIEEVFAEAGFPKGLFRNLPIEARRVSGVIESPEVKAVTLTGSTPAGKAVAGAAGAVLKKAVLELGGSDPYIVLADADIAAAAETCAASRLINGGQSCIAAKRFIVVESVLEEFTHRFIAAMEKRKVGDPLDESVDLGPMARVDLRDELHDQVRRSVDAGAQLVLGGEVPEGKGAFYPPTVLTGVEKGMPAYSEETFGPVASVIRVANEDEAFEVANDSVFGLGAAVFTRDAERGEKLAKERVEAGCVFVNDFVKSDPRLPFGGIKESGFGRELASFGIREFVNIKTVSVA